MYTVEEEAKLKDLYLNQEMATEAIATELGKTKRSVIAKLATLKIYKPVAKVSKATGGAPKTKEQYAKEIAEILECGELQGLDKAPKQTLIKLQNCLVEWFGEDEE